MEKFKKDFVDDRVNGKIKLEMQTQYKLNDADKMYIEKEGY